MSLSRETALAVMDHLIDRGISCGINAYPKRPYREDQGAFYYVETRHFGELTPGNDSYRIIAEVALEHSVDWRIHVLDGTTGPRGRLNVQFL
jgi:hypothetical protein